VQLDDPPRERRPEAGALRLLREERLEDPVAVFDRHARTLVRDLDDQLIAGARGDADRRARLHRVLDQVREHLAHPVLIDDPH
jgi:hypothetical protein